MGDEEAPQFGLRRVPVLRARKRPTIFRLLPPGGRWPMDRRGFLRATALTVGGALAGAGCSSGGGGAAPETSSCPAPSTPPLDEAQYRAYAETETRAHAARVNLLAFSPDGRFLASAGGSAGTAGNGNRDWTEVKLWSMPTGELHANLSDGFPAAGLVFSDDGTQLHVPTGSLVRSLHTWDVEPTRLASSISGVQGQTWVIRNDVVKAAIGWVQGTTSMLVLGWWNVLTGAKLLEAINDVDGAIFNVLLDRAGAQMAVAFTDGTVRIHEATGARQLRYSLAGQADPPVMAFSHDGSLLATAGGLLFGSSDANPALGDTTIKLWSTATGELLRTLVGHGNKINSLAFSGDGSLLVSGSGGNSTTAGLPTFTSPGVNPLATAFDENSVRVWEVATGAQLHAFTGQAYRVRAVAISPDGRYVAAGSQDNTIKVWRLPDATLLAGLFDSGALEPQKTASYVATTLSDGQPVQRAFPATAELPAGAACTCHCVEGSYTPKPPAGGDPCQLVCVCVPVIYGGS